MTTQKRPVTRAPRGVLSEKPVYMRLMPEERRDLERISGLENRSTSSMARRLYLIGVRVYKTAVLTSSQSTPAAGD